MSQNQSSQLHFRYYNRTKRCYPVSSKGPCGTNMAYFAEDETYGECGCQTTDDRLLIYNKKQNQCYFIFQQVFKFDSYSKSDTIRSKFNMLYYCLYLGLLWKDTMVGHYSERNSNLHKKPMYISYSRLKERFCIFSIKMCRGGRILVWM